MAIKKNLLNYLAGPIISASALLSGGCIDYNGPTCQPGYGVSNVSRPKVDGSLERWIALYNSMKRMSSVAEVYDLNKEEAAYLEKFDKMSMRKQKEKFRNPGLKEFHFLNRENPRISDIIFLYHFERFLNKENQGITKEIISLYQ